MTFRVAALKNRYSTVLVEDDDGVLVPIESDLPDALSILNYRLEIADLGNAIHGMCNFDERLIQISASLNDSDFVSSLLHEMIHAHEGTLELAGLNYQFAFYLRDMVTKRHGAARVSKLLSGTGHIDALRAPGHSLLFWLKSFDLDLRFNLKLGDVAGYGREELLVGI